MSSAFFFVNNSIDRTFELSVDSDSYSVLPLGLHKLNVTEFDLYSDNIASHIVNLEVFPKLTNNTIAFNVTE